MGNMLTIENSSFISNTNTAGGALYIGASSNYFFASISLSHVYFGRNNAYTFGGAISFGSDILKLQGTFFNVTCTMNSGLCNKIKI